ncbi:MAG: glycine zipper family protein [Planctomycetes bacterium]|nr:glycine zipper family protein [Planctomycetota bacterium]
MAQVMIRGWCALVLAAAVGCKSTTITRLPAGVEETPTVIAPAPKFAPAPAPQRMVDPVVSPADRDVAPSITEEQRTAAFRNWVGDRRSYTPPAPELRLPLESSSRVVEREVRYVSTGHFHTSRCTPGYALGRVAVYTGVGAVIGQQFHDRGRGAAIGAGLALLTGPWWFGWSCWCDG